MEVKSPNVREHPDITSAVSLLPEVLVFKGALAGQKEF